MRLGATPEHVDVVLSVERLRRQLAYEPGDMTTTVQAGLPLEELQGVLRAQGQFVALDPPATAATTTGGVIATNASGPRRLLYGTARDVVLGVSVATADGARSKAGGRVVKNVTGYDLTKLYIGSLGTLGVVLELTFKVHPLPPGEETIGITCAGHADILSMLSALLRLPLRLSSLELLNAAALSAVQAGSGVALPASPYLFLARLEGDAAVAAGQKQRIADTLRGLSLSAPADTLAWQPEEQSRLWASLAAQPFLPDSVTAKVGLRITDLAAFCTDIEAVPADPPWLLHAHAGNGIVSVQIPAVNSSEETLLAQIRVLDGCVVRLNGHRVIERGAGGRQAALRGVGAGGRQLCRHAGAQGVVRPPAAAQPRTFYWRTVKRGRDGVVTRFRSGGSSRSRKRSARASIAGCAWTSAPPTARWARKWTRRAGACTSLRQWTRGAWA